MLSTEAGWIGKVEVVRLQYDPKVISYNELCRLTRERGYVTSAFAADEKELAVARKHFGDATQTHTGDIRLVKDQKYYLRRTPLRHVPMTPLQAARLNALLDGGQLDKARQADVLSPRQLELLAFIEKHPDAGWEDVALDPILTAWPRVEARRAKVE